MTTTEATLTGERADLLETLGQHRHFLRNTLRGLTDQQAAQRPTVSELSLGGLIKHVARVERSWADFIADGPASSERAASQGDDWASGFRMLEGETVAGLLEEYDAVAARTDAIVRDLPDLDASHPLPEAPWFPPGKRWSARRVLLHIVAETSQHAGHADILRESIDGAKSMG